MPHAYAAIAFTPAVKAAQVRDGSRPGYARNFEEDDEVTHALLGEREREYLAAARSFYMATVSETSWPYIQHRGGPRGFLKVIDEQKGYTILSRLLIDERTLAFTDFAGNRQMISVGNAAGNDRVSLFVMDYAGRQRLKILGRLAIDEVPADDPRLPVLLEPGYRARAQRVMTVAVEGFDWNCSQHIPVRIDAEDVEAALAARDARIVELEALLARAGAGQAADAGRETV